MSIFSLSHFPHPNPLPKGEGDEEPTAESSRRERELLPVLTAKGEVILGEKGERYLIRG
jgi:hypothetical protein